MEYHCDGVPVRCEQCQLKLLRKDRDKHIFEQCPMTETELKFAFATLVRRHDWEPTGLDDIVKLNRSVLSIRDQVQQVKQLANTQHTMIEQFLNAVGERDKKPNPLGVFQKTKEDQKAMNGFKGAFDKSKQNALTVRSIKTRSKDISETKSKVDAEKQDISKLVRNQKISAEESKYEESKQSIDGGDRKKDNKKDKKDKKEKKDKRSSRKEKTREIIPDPQTDVGQYEAELSQIGSNLDMGSSYTEQIVPKTEKKVSSKLYKLSQSSVNFKQEQKELIGNQIYEPKKVNADLNLLPGSSSSKKNFDDAATGFMMAFEGNTKDIQSSRRGSETSSAFDGTSSNTITTDRSFST